MWQGFWPDGLHTAPTDEALCYDMQVAINTGFTTLRKHIKVEPDRWYSCADRCMSALCLAVVHCNHLAASSSELH